MTIHRFVNRSKELEALDRWAKESNVGLITGRRRVGKTRLVQQFLQDRKGIYLLASDRGYEYNLGKFSEEISKKFGIPGLRFRDFEELFGFLETRKNIEIIVIDEFGYLVKTGALGEFQRILDTVLKHKKLLFTGSSVSLLEARVLGYRSPLYGRIDLVKKIRPLEFFHLFEWFRGISFGDALKIYATTGAIPRYLEFFRGKNAEKEIKSKILSPDLLLFRDAKLLLEEELPEPSRYFLILESIASGKNKISEISNHSGIKTTNLPYYLNTLRSLGFVRREKPILGKKKGIYAISDFYMHFWFRFVSPFFEEIEAGLGDSAVAKFEKEFNTFLGPVFEDICLKYLYKTFSFEKVGRWWHKDREIDVIGLNEEKKEILFGECKWKDRVNPEKILEELLEKSGHVKWNNSDRKEWFAVFAKSFSKKTSSFRGRKVYCFDLKDLKKLV